MAIDQNNSRLAGQRLEQYDTQTYVDRARKHYASKGKGLTGGSQKKARGAIGSGLEYEAGLAGNQSSIEPL